jgi:hypothetical protein
MAPPFLNPADPLEKWKVEAVMATCTKTTMHSGGRVESTFITSHEFPSAVRGKTELSFEYKNLRSIIIGGSVGSISTGGMLILAPIEPDRTVFLVVKHSGGKKVAVIDDHDTMVERYFPQYHNLIHGFTTGVPLVDFDKDPPQNTPTNDETKELAVAFNEIQKATEAVKKQLIVKYVKSPNRYLRAYGQWLSKSNSK